MKLDMQKLATMMVKHNITLQKDLAKFIKISEPSVR
jgi:hypothetical protein